MEPKTRVFVTLGVIVVMIVGMYIFSDWFSKATGYVLGEDQKAAFVTCLNEQGDLYFEQANCVECDKQRDELGEKAYQLLNKKTCGNDLCQGLKNVPAWSIEGKFYYGVQTFQDLNKISSCEIK
jgi:hypothetical protein